MISGQGLARFVGAIALAACSLAVAQNYPTKPVRWIVPFAPGGPNDLLTRVIAPSIATNLGQPVVVENRAASGGIVGTEAVAKSAPDGYTVLTTNGGTLVMQKQLYRKLPYDPEKDFASVSLLAQTPVGLFIHASVPATTLKEFIAHLKANPGKLNYGSAGVGQPFMLAMEMLKQRTGTEVVHIPYKGAGEFIPALVSGTVHAIVFPPVEQLLAQVKAGKLRALAIGDEQRLAATPDVPTFKEAGLDNFSIPGWIAVALPAGSPKSVVDRLNREIARAVVLPEAQGLYQKLNMIPAAGSQEEMNRLIRMETQSWTPVIRSLGIVLD